MVQSGMGTRNGGGRQAASMWTGETTHTEKQRLGLGGMRVKNKRKEPHCRRGEGAHKGVLEVCWTTGLAAAFLGYPELAPVLGLGWPYDKPIT